MSQSHYPSYADYAPLLKELNIPFRTVGSRFIVGDYSMNGKWLIYVSILMKETEQVLKKVLPVLVQQELPFAMIRNQFYHHQLNSGLLGEAEIGKVIIISSDSLQQTINTKNSLVPLLECVDGPCIQGALQVTGAISMCYCELDEETNDLITTAPPKLLSRITPNREIKRRQVRRRVIVNSYVPFKLLSQNTKAMVYQGIIIKHLKLDWCLIKQGNPFMGEDAHGRMMKDRLLWEKRSLECLHAHVPCPSVIDFVEQNASYYLILEYIDGFPLNMACDKIRKGRKWTELETAEQEKLIIYFKQVLDIIEMVHRCDYVHRDIKESNFIVTPSDKIKIIDFELSYDLSTNQPVPPYIMGTPGYVCPEQLDYKKPTKKEDIFSLGALLAYILTGILPTFLFQNGMKAASNKLHQETQDLQLTELVGICMEARAELRPDIPDIRTSLLRGADKQITKADNPKILQAI